MPAYRCPACLSQRTADTEPVYCPLCYDEMERVPDPTMLPWMMSDVVPERLRATDLLMRHNRGVRSY